MVAEDDWLTAWPGLLISQRAYGTGLINQTLLGTLADRPVVIQAVHPVFAPSVHEDIEAVTRHLAARAVTTPRLIRTAAGALCHQDAAGTVRRVLTFAAGQAVDRFDSVAEIERAGALVARFHGALADCGHTFVHVRPGVHDLPYRADEFEQTLNKHGKHRLIDEVQRARARLRALEPYWLSSEGLPLRTTHGDLKASNLLLCDEPLQSCLVDLDTVGRMILPYELGDALRSWCNPAGENVASAGFNVASFEAALAGYASGLSQHNLAVQQGGAGAALWLREAETATIARGVLTIASELALRFLTDSLSESYFGWDATRYATRGEHNLLRAQGQLALAESVRDSLAVCEPASRKLLSHLVR